MDLGEVEQIERNLVLQDGEIGAVFGAQVTGFEIGQAGGELLVESALSGQASRAEIVQHLIEVLFLVLVQTGRGGRGGGKGEGAVNEVVGKRGQLLRRVFAAANGEESKAEQGTEFRHSL